DGRVRAEDLHPVVEEVDRLSSLLTSLLTFEKTREPAMRDEPVAPVLRRCIGLIQPQAVTRNIEIRAEMGHPDIEARFDPEQLTQVVMNLLVNAMEADGQNGTNDVCH